jgi:hypothetical protein
MGKGNNIYSGLFESFKARKYALLFAPIIAGAPNLSTMTPDIEVILNLKRILFSSAIIKRL